MTRNMFLLMAAEIGISLLGLALMSSPMMLILAGAGLKEKIYDRILVSGFVVAMVSMFVFVANLLVALTADVLASGC